jgi:hypothetical protein
VESIIALVAASAADAATPVLSEAAGELRERGTQAADAAARASTVLRHLVLCAAEGRARALPPASEAWAEAMGALLSALQLRAHDATI